MRNIVFSPVLIIFSLSGCVSTSVDVAGEPQSNLEQQSYSTVTDFRGVVLGEKPPADVVFKLLEGDFNAARNEMYTRSDDEMRIGDVEIESIFYSFFDEYLYAVQIDVGEDKFCRDFESVKNSIEIKYKTKLRNKFPDKHDFKFYTAEFENLNIVVSCDTWLSGTNTHETSVSISHPSVERMASKHDKEIQDRSVKEKAVKGAKDL